MSYALAVVDHGHTLHAWNFDLQDPVADRSQDGDTLGGDLESSSGPK